MLFFSSCPIIHRGEIMVRFRHSKSSSAVNQKTKSNKCDANCRGVINGKAGKAAALSKFSYTLIPSQSGGADYTQQLALPHLNFSVITPLRMAHKTSSSHLI